MSPSGLRPAEELLLLEPKSTGTEVIQKTIHQLIFEGIIEVETKKINPTGMAYINTFYFKLGKHFHDYQPDPYELIPLSPFEKINSSIPLPLYTSMVLEKLDWEPNDIIHQYLFPQLLDKNLFKSTWKNKLRIFPKTTEGKKSTEIIKANIKDAQQVFQELKPEAFISLNERVGFSYLLLDKVPFRALTKMRMQIFQLLLDTIKEKEDEGNPETDLESLKPLLNLISNPNFTFHLFVENFDQQLIGGLDNEE